MQPPSARQIPLGTLIPVLLCFPAFLVNYFIALPSALDARPLVMALEVGAAVLMAYGFMMTLIVPFALAAWLVIGGVMWDLKYIKKWQSPRSWWSILPIVFCLIIGGTLGFVLLFTIIGRLLFSHIAASLAHEPLYLLSISALLLGICGGVVAQNRLRAFIHRDPRAPVVAQGIAIVLVGALILWGNYETKHAIPNPYWGIFNGAYSYSASAPSATPDIVATPPETIAQQYLHDYITVGGTFPCASDLAAYQPDSNERDPVLDGQACPIHRPVQNYSFTSIHIQSVACSDIGTCEQAVVRYHINYTTGETFTGNIMLQPRMYIHYYHAALRLNCWGSVDTYAFYLSMIQRHISLPTLPGMELPVAHSYMTICTGTTNQQATYGQATRYYQPPHGSGTGYLFQWLNHCLGLPGGAHGGQLHFHLV